MVYPLTAMAIVLIMAALTALCSTLGHFLHVEVSGNRTGYKI